MLILCPNCGTSYQLGPDSLGDVGRSVRCASCNNVWFQEPFRTTALQDAEADAPGADAWPIRPLDDVVDMVAPDPDMTAQDDSLEDASGYPYEPAAHASDPDTFGSHDTRRPADAVRAGPPPSWVRDRDGFRNDDAATRQTAGARLQAAARRRATAAPPIVPVLICTMILALVCIVAARQQMVRIFPQTAALYALAGMPVNLRNLEFSNVRTIRDVQDGIPVLMVEGEIVGTRSTLTEIPRLRLAVLDKNGKEIYAWTARPERNLLPPGQSLPFVSRLGSPPADAAGVTVRFFNRYDAQAGLM